MDVKFKQDQTFHPTSNIGQNTAETGATSNMNIGCWMLDIGFACSRLNYIFVLVSINDSEMLETSLEISSSVGINQQSNVTIKNSLKQRKISEIISKSNIGTSTQSSSPANPHEYRFLPDALGELELEEDDIDVVLLRLKNGEDGDTDTQVCSDADTAEIKLAQIMEIQGILKCKFHDEQLKAPKKE